MLDENLPTFYLKPVKDSHLSTVYLLQYGNEPDPAYSLRYPDPLSPDSKNRFAAALYDPYIPDVVYGEVLIIPEWTQPTLSAEAIRQNGGVAPSPEPILPTRFTIQLYNPDQQVIVHYKPKTWNSPPSWSFEMPQHSFREPTGSTLDRVQIDPAVADTTPKLRFIWRKDSKLSKDLTCLLRGKTTAIPETKTKSKEPDITVSIFKSLRELTLYEPNLYRVEMEDFKGLEVVLLLGAITIRDIYFASPKEAFRISRQNSASVSPTSNSPTTTPPANRLPASPGGLVTDIPSAPQPPPVRSPLLTKQQEQARMEEERQTKRLLEEEEKVRRRRQAEVDKETRRLQKLYGEEERKARTQTPSLPPRQPAQQIPNPALRPYSQYNHGRPPMPHGGSRPYLQLPGQMSTMSLLTPPVAGPQAAAKPLQNKRSSFFGLRRVSEEGKLTKKRSSMF
ncbi:uncharacterized protein DSM5745_04766 [Aspergillus mulundensis]|uniref:Uncharacterized protein n=1 Tax=Aspergillus mulundensis TaxID=1810919 RepID=A0A3D8S4K5_9EURO|nr:Uncharacterized protein DSM5745_04766 [Aspergillus mulundensis]RDW81209.1 Uncharacterized protein DSM5745_04766 [Aspergillus mulundensis]